MENQQRLEIIKKVDAGAILNEYGIFFKIDDIKVIYDTKEKKFFVSEEFFGKIPHIMKNGQICLYGNWQLYLNEFVEENSLESIVSTYIPWLFRLPLDLKLLEFLFEIEFYIKYFLGYKVEEKDLTSTLIYKSVKIENVSQLWELIYDMEQHLTYKVYISGHEDYAIFLQKNGKKIIYERDRYKKARQRVTGGKCDNLSGKTMFIGVGSVNSYIIKYCLANGLKEIVLVDYDKYTVDNAFRFAFPYKGNRKIYAVKEFCKNLKEIKLEFIHQKITAKSDGKILKNCGRIIVSVDNFMSWLEIATFLEKNCTEDVEIIFAAINNFGENAKFFKTTLNGLDNKVIDFLFKSKVKERRELIGNGCGKSIAVYDEEILIKLAKRIVKSIIENESGEEIVYVEI